MDTEHSDDSQNIIESSDEETTKQTDFDTVEEMLLEFDEQQGLIRNRSLLDPNYVVDEDRIVGRNKQLKEITEMLRVTLGGNKPPNLFLYGTSGTGKTLITKAVCNSISELCESRDIRFGTVEVNCQDLDTIGVAVYELVKETAEQVDAEIDVPKHGVSTKDKWDELYRIVEAHYDSIIFILDELDLLIGRRDKDEPAFSRLLYQLTRKSGEEDFSTKISVVALSNDTKMLESVGSRALSSFTPEEVSFGDYESSQLNDILQRRKDAFYDGVLTDDVIPLAAAFGANTHGDARKAIDLLRVSGELAERNGDQKVGEEHVRQAQEKVEKNRVLEVVRGVTQQKKLCLYSAAIVANQSEAGVARSGVGYQIYRHITDKLEIAQYHQETYVNNLKELTTYSLINCERKSHGPSSGMFLEVQFEEDPATIAETIQEESRLNSLDGDTLRTIVKSEIQKGK